MLTQNHNYSYYFKAKSNSLEKSECPFPNPGTRGKRRWCWEASRVCGRETAGLQKAGTAGSPDLPPARNTPPWLLRWPWSGGLASSRRSRSSSKETQERKTSPDTDGRTGSIPDLQAEENLQSWKGGHDAPTGNPDLPREDRGISGYDGSEARWKYSCPALASSHSISRAVSRFSGTS
ncbi:MAG: hypothetical protein A4E74_00486 [Syntrophus sp. PtaB.Bin075]|nr:MAG: hypothetical protein A4E74_00486 [Syntrophus sp. PtaB.Bin075]